MHTNCLNYRRLRKYQRSMDNHSTARFESSRSRAVGVEKMGLRVTNTKRRVLLTRPAAAARLLSGQGQGGGGIFKKSEKFCLLLDR